MKPVRLQVGGYAFEFRTLPRGSSGAASCALKDGRVVDVRWRRDCNGIWIELPWGVYGFDFDGERGEDGSVEYRVSQRGSDGEWAGIRVLRSGEEKLAGTVVGSKKGVRVRAQMPGKILRVSIEQGQVVERGASLAVMEAMKMENEIRAPQAGTVTRVAAVVGQAVETGADLFVIEPLTGVG